MKRITGILLTGLMLFTVACEKLLLPDPGELQRVKQEYDYFSKISIQSIFDIELASDSVFSLEIEAFEGYLENIIIALDSNNLKITDNNKLKSLAAYPRPRLKISFPRLDDSFLIDFPVNMISADTLHLPKFIITSLGKTGDLDLLLDVDLFQIATGSDNYGSYNFRGRAGDARFWPRGSSIVDASELHTEDCYVYNNSIGDCSVNVNRRLEVRLNTLGNIFYYGDPEEIIIVEESGSGRLLAAEK